MTDQPAPSKWTSRKLIVGISMEMLFTGLLIGGFVPPETYYQLTVIAIGGYFLGNVGEHFSSRRA